jgi:hypothetical protein
MGAATLILFVLPWLDRGKVKSIRYRGPKYRVWFALFIVAFLLLGYLGVEPTTVWGEFGKGLPVDRRRLRWRCGSRACSRWSTSSSSCSCPGTPPATGEAEPARVTW